LSFSSRTRSSFFIVLYSLRLSPLEAALAA
jgi:hypothetical protein